MDATAEAAYLWSIQAQADDPEVRSSALRQLLDEYQTSEVSMRRIQGVLQALGLEDAAATIASAIAELDATRPTHRRAYMLARRDVIVSRIAS